MDMSSILNSSPSAGPPARKGDSVKGPKGLVEGMKVGLKAHYTKTGEITEKQANPIEMYRDPSLQAPEEEVAPSEMKEALKTGLRAWYTKHGGLQESTVSANVGARLPERALGGWSDGRPSKRRAKPMEKGGSSLRDDIQRLEKHLEGTLATLSNKHALSDGKIVGFRNQLADALSDVIVRGNTKKLRHIKMQATLFESDFIGDAAPETDEPLTNENDLGAVFFSKMGEEHVGPIVEMVSNQLRSGMPLITIRSNVAAALQSTNAPGMRETLSRAARVLSEL
jgi:hypothetical protein